MENYTQNLKKLFTAKGKKLVLIEFDSALFVKQVKDFASTLNDALLKKLQGLSQSANARVVLMTGRTRTSIERLVGHLPVDILAEHGAYYKKNGSWMRLIEDDGGWKNSLFSTFVEYTVKCPGAIVEEKELSLSWNFSQCDIQDGQNFAEQLIEELEPHRKKYNLRTIVTDGVVEFLPAHLSKSRAALLLTNENSFDHMLTIGDEYIEEEVFKVLFPINACHTIKVGQGPTSAKYTVQNKKQVLDLINTLSAKRIRI